MKQVFITTVATILLFIFLYFLFVLVMFSPIYNSRCGLSSGPYYGNEITMDPDTIAFDEKIEYPKGTIAVANRSKSEAPILVAFDKNDEISWAIEMQTDSLEIPLLTLNGLKLENNYFNYRISFFNKTWSEPGYALIKRNGKFRCFCLSAF